MQKSSRRICLRPTMFRTACDKRVTTSQPATPPTANLEHVEGHDLPRPHRTLTNHAYASRRRRPIPRPRRRHGSLPGPPAIDRT
jgi:hypothetical protein